jgi:hypothetical protein
MNTGGRKKFAKGEQVRILELDGQVSEVIYLIDPESSTQVVRADRKGHVSLEEQGSARKVKVHFRRILPTTVDNEAPVIESGDKFVALCPKCGEAIGVIPSSTEANCHTCGSFKLHWTGVKPMADATQTKTKPDTAKKKDKTKVERKTKPVREPIVPDLDAIKALQECELWAKLGVKFDHPSIDVRSYTILYTGTNPRKFCFNTYNGTLGKRADALPLENFIADQPIKDAKNQRPWYSVADLDKVRAKLEKDGYERQ